MDIHVMTWNTNGLQSSRTRGSRRRLLRKDLQKSVVGDIDILMIQEHKIAHPFGTLMSLDFRLSGSQPLGNTLGVVGKRWPSKQVFGDSFQFSGGKNAFEERVRASQKFEFLDPYFFRINDSGTRVNHILLVDNLLYATKGTSISVYDVESQKNYQCLAGHNAQITCMRLVRSTGLLSLRDSGADTHPVVLTSSMDHTIRLWRKGYGLRTLRGHSGPVATLSNSLLGGQSGKPTLASGGMDGTIRLWNLSSGQKRGSSPLVKTFHGHEFAVKQLVVAEYNPSLLVSAGKDSKLRVWDVTSTSTGALVGSMKGPRVPVGLACKESICYVAGGSTLILVDLRSMLTITTIGAHNCGILDFSMPVSGNVVCTGGAEKTAKLWDLRNVEEPYSTLGGHEGDVNFVHMDSYKVVTGGSGDAEVYVWGSQTGEQLNALELSNGGLTALTVQGVHIATGSSDGTIQYRDFSNCTIPIRQAALEDFSKENLKFWETSFWDSGTATNETQD
ncbi:hypothetical protein L7F22_018414 [Adiantum nelumboides]|nr:hypothetical protein [Adiantum nelumboides]